jgi:hypothetical protein
MSATEPEPAAYRALADRVKDAEQSEVWDAFGQEMDERAREGADDHPVAGFRLSLSHHRMGTDADLADIIHVAHRQFGGSSEGLARNAVARESEVYAIRTTDARNAVEAARQSVVAALQNAARGGRFPEGDSE